jgi:ferritin-like metal-binding protein YciE
MQKPPERIIRYLIDAHAAEAELVELLEGLLRETREETVHSALEQLYLQTKDQALRVEVRLRALGSQPTPTTSFLSGVLGKVSGLVHAAHDGYDKTTQDVIKAYSVEHLQIGSYAALATFARLAGDPETETLAAKIMEEEQVLANTLRPLIDDCSTRTFEAANR